MTQYQFILKNITINVIKKSIKNLHLSVYPPEGRVRIAAPYKMNSTIIELFALSKLDWIKHQQQKFAAKIKESSLQYIAHESHYLWGQRYLLKITIGNRANVIHSPQQLLLTLPLNSSLKKRQIIMENWFRNELRTAIIYFIAKWEPILNVKVIKFFVQKMKTRWGSCNFTMKHIRINSQLIKKPREYLEYIIVHEMIHLLEPSHNQRFKSLMTQFMPQWRYYRQALNR